MAHRASPPDGLLSMDSRTVSDHSVHWELCHRFSTSVFFSQTLHGTAIDADQLGWFQGGQCRHILQSHGVFGFVSLWPYYDIL